MSYHIVWNSDKTLGFITTDAQLAYEARKGSDSNCYDEHGKVCRTAQGFTDDTVNEDCTIEKIDSIRNVDESWDDVHKKLDSYMRNEHPIGKIAGYNHQQLFDYLKNNYEVPIKKKI